MSRSLRTDRTARSAGFALVLLSCCLFRTYAAVASPSKLSSSIPPIVADSKLVGGVDASRPITLNFVLPFRNQAELDQLVKDQYTPGSPSYGKYISSAEFHARFSPSQADYDAVKAFAVSKGLTISSELPSRKLLQVKGTADTVQKAFGVHLLNYQAKTGRTFFAPDSEPKLPPEIASIVRGVSGLTNSAYYTPAIKTKLMPQSTVLPSLLNENNSANSRLLKATNSPLSAGSAANGGLTPTDIETAYNLKVYPPAVSGDTKGYGSGQVLGLFELDVYLPSDILLYEEKYNLPHLSPTDEIDPTNPVTPTGGNDEVTLDIELQLAVAPQAQSILVYQGGNESTLVTQQYQKIADDDFATQISTSWGAPETTNDTTDLDGEYDAFEQMAAQGQSIFAAAGDNGAYDGAGTSSTVNGTDATALLVDDPASQPYMTGVGGTTLTVVDPAVDESYLSESSWGTPADSTGDAASGGGGGVSRIWQWSAISAPNYQEGIVPSPGAIPDGYPSAGTGAPNPDPTLYRNVPDVSFNANPDSGYDIVYDGVADELFVVGGTSAAAPVWAGFTALVNEQRAYNGLPNVGFVNPILYTIAKDGLTGGSTYHYEDVFHDIDDGSTNLYFPAVTGYDNSTGLGSFNGLSLISDLSSPPPPGFMAVRGDQSAYLSWYAVPGATSYTVFGGPISGPMPKLVATHQTSYVATGLTNGQQYSFTLRANYPTASSFADGPVKSLPVSGSFTTQPTIAVLRRTTALINWRTNVPANSKVIYGSSPTTLTGSAAKGSLSLEHSITITGLSPAQTYYYQLISNDGVKNITSQVLSFTTK